MNDFFMRKYIYEDVVFFNTYIMHERIFFSEKCINECMIFLRFILVLFLNMYACIIFFFENAYINGIFGNACTKF